MKDAPSIDPAEVAKFSAMAAQWWDPNGLFAPLHKFNPLRLRYIQETAARHFKKNGQTRFDGLTLLDIGCGGGLVAEPMAKLGFAVTGADASEKNILAARVHAAEGNVSIDYKNSTAEDLTAENRTFDVVLNLEVVEHVADLSGYLRACSKLVKPGGLMFVASLNKTLKSLALAKIGVEYVLGWLPRGSHDWSRFVPPETIHALLEENSLKVLTTQGIAFDPLSWDWALSGDVGVNYMVVANRTLFEET
jgi:2-polyprenyl-6-hydroxyphenyl methylase / 3-demethylubiquinone-9 3-methyltransferase